MDISKDDVSRPKGDRLRIRQQWSEAEWQLGLTQPEGVLANGWE